MNAHYICFIALEEELEYLDERLVHFNFYNKAGGYIPGRQAYQYSKKDTRSGGKIDLTVYPNREMGNIGAAVRVNTELRDNNFQAAFIVGIAGSLDISRHKLGNVVVSASSKFLSPDKLFETNVDVERLKRVGTNNAFRFRRDFIELEKTTDFLDGYIDFRTDQSDWSFSPITKELLEHDDELLQYANEEPSVKYGCILGSDWVVDSAELVKFLIERDQDESNDWYVLHERPVEKEARNKWNWLPKFRIACVDMESYGFFRAIRSAKIQAHAISIRGISDPCSNKRGIEKKSKAIRKAAMDNAVDVFVDMVMYTFDQDASRRK